MSRQPSDAPPAVRGPRKGQDRQNGGQGVGSKAASVDSKVTASPNATVSQGGGHRAVSSPTSPPLRVIEAEKSQLEDQIAQLGKSLEDEFRVLSSLRV